MSLHSQAFSHRHCPILQGTSPAPCPQLGTNLPDSAPFPSILHYVFSSTSPFCLHTLLRSARCPSYRSQVANLTSPPSNTHLNSSEDYIFPFSASSPVSSSRQTSYAENSQLSSPIVSETTAVVVPAFRQATFTLSNSVCQPASGSAQIHQKCPTTTTRGNDKRAQERGPAEMTTMILGTIIEIQSRQRWSDDREMTVFLRSRK